MVPEFPSCREVEAMRNPLRVTGLVAVLALLCAANAAAQRPQTRRGFWIAFGFGYGSADITCDACPETDREGSATGHLRLGGTLSPKLLLGGDVTGWAKEENGATLGLGTVSFIAQYYPKEQGGLFLKGGAGFSSATIEVAGEQAGASSWGLSAGVGYDIRVGRNISLTPIADFLIAGKGDLQVNGQTALEGLGWNVFTLGLGVTFH
jgi:hypothetical protein